jgi:uncharacterized protein YbjT (DUF2867 family)
MPIGRTVLLAGATGLVGRECLRLLLAAPFVERLVVLSRRALPAAAVAALGGPKLEAYEIDFSRLDQYANLLAVDQIVCSLGTTIKAAGSRARFRDIDYGIPYSIARLGSRKGAHHFLLVSALGANAGSRIFYNRVKGELEDAVRALPFRSVTILRPSLLIGERTEPRVVERFAGWSAFLWPKRLKPVRARRVANALIRASEADAPGVRVIESEEM